MGTTVLNLRDEYSGEGLARAQYVSCVWVMWPTGIEAIRYPIYGVPDSKVFMLKV